MQKPNTCKACNADRAADGPIALPDRGRLLILEQPSRPDQVGRAEAFKSENGPTKIARRRSSARSVSASSW
jgi:hypothetical protein